MIETERLSLRRLDPDDAGFIFELVNDPDWLRNIGDRGVRNLDDARRYIDEGPRTMYANHGFGLYAVVLRESGTPIGLCGLLQRDYLDHADIGFAFLPAYRGRGYAREAAQATLIHGARDFAMNTILATTAPDNDDSIRLLQDLGFRFDAMRAFDGDGDAEPVRLFVWRSSPSPEPTP